jgi:hypothetical protein
MWFLLVFLYNVIVVANPSTSLRIGGELCRTTDIPACRQVALFS